MSVSTYAIVFGRRSLDELAAALSNSGAVGGPVEVDQRRERGSLTGWLLFPEHGGGDRRVAVFDGAIGDYGDVYAGERTLLSCGASGDSAAFMTAVARAFGGFVLPSDAAAEEDGWKAVARSDELVLAPDQKLAVALAPVLSVAEMEIVRKLAADPDKARAVAEALNEFVAETGAAPRPPR